MSNFFYTLIIYPLYQIIEVVYRVFFEICKNEGISIIGVSIAVTLLCLPLYAVAENWQQIERNTQKKLAPGIERIKKTFKGDEQYMMLTTFYRQNHYHPMMALRSSFGLLIQIPFFIAAYSYLSNNHDIIGKSFLFINDLGKADALFSIGNFPVNVLPIAMTLINIIAGAIYTKGFPVKEKIQIYGMALLFLIILYGSPSGLVLYWTMNNVFSLVKNIFYKLKNPIKVFWIMMSIFAGFASVFVFAKMNPFQASPVILLAVMIITAPIWLRGVHFIITDVLKDLLDSNQKRTGLFIFSALSIAILTGIVIPSFLITASTAGDYAYIDNYTTPLYFVYNSTLQCMGLFFLWPAAVYFLFGKKIQTGISAVFFIGLILSLINAFCFQGDYGNVSPELVFTEHKSFKPSMMMFLINSAVLLGTVIFILFLFKKRLFIAINALSSIVFIAMAGLSFINCIRIQNDFKKIEKNELQITDIKPIINFSKTGKNVLIFMLDRAAGYLIEDAFAECPEMSEQYTGFTFYPNTISFGSWTIQGAPGLYGGYEYTPWSMNHRRDIPMQEKHNQALSMLAFMFENEGFSSYVIDPPYPNYDTTPVFSFFDGHTDVHPVEAIGKYSDIWYTQNNYEKLPIKSMLIKRNFIWFSLFKIVPPVLRSAVHYQDWWSSPTATESVSDFINRYSVLDFLPKLTAVNSDKDCFIFFDNESTHDTGYCQPPEYTPIVRGGVSEVQLDLIKNERWKEDRGFHGLLASLKRIGEWLEFLKENDVYDNTRIIIVADHGSNQTSPLFDGEPTEKRNLEWFNPMLMVKDFYAAGTLKQDDTFMTQADTPALAVTDVLKNPINPFTGNEIKLLSTEEKYKNTIISFSKANAVRSTVNNGYKIQDDDWFTVTGSIFKKDNWKQLKVQNDVLLEE